jgi:hypothetical protein
MGKNLQYIDIEIDKLTNSLENVITGDSFPTAIVLANSDPLQKKKDGYLIGNPNLRNLTEMFTN